MLLRKNTGFYVGLVLGFTNVGVALLCYDFVYYISYEHFMSYSDRENPYRFTLYILVVLGVFITFLTSGLYFAWVNSIVNSNGGSKLVALMLSFLYVVIQIVLLFFGLVLLSYTGFSLPT